MTVLYTWKTRLPNFTGPVRRLAVGTLNDHHTSEPVWMSTTVPSAAKRSFWLRVIKSVSRNEVRRPPPRTCAWNAVSSRSRRSAQQVHDVQVGGSSLTFSPEAIVCSISSSRSDEPLLIGLGLIIICSSQTPGIKSFSTCESFRREIRIIYHSN